MRAELKIINILTSEVAPVVSLMASFGGLLAAFWVLSESLLLFTWEINDYDYVVDDDDDEIK